MFFPCSTLFFIAFSRNFFLLLLCSCCCCHYCYRRVCVNVCFLLKHGFSIGNGRWWISTMKNAFFKKKSELFISHAYCTQMLSICRLSITVKMLPPLWYFKLWTVTQNITSFLCGASRGRKIIQTSIIFDRFSSHFNAFGCVSNFFLSLTAFLCCCCCRKSLE